MNRHVQTVLVVNIFLASLFVYLNSRALAQNLEETFVSLAVMYGIVAIVVNTGLVYWGSRK